jgi:hypothetical protein
VRLSWKVVVQSDGAPTTIGSRWVAEPDWAVTEEALRRLYGELAPMLAAAILDALVMAASSGRPPWHPAVTVELDVDQLRGPSE